ncbi:DNA-binding MarR family transcriptional regulator [Streptomonospora nanhaiensis]|uniref:DNA-binding MarR family transcriptional regulator n=1 Tax=Streptomonospora nanhaiensis TaxID=1323731 RepID=A0A853BJ66_9ACTN|nr:MarR family transcriptional regulator [Streptomonospora nanhaiensis]NYI94566.1 DNA-binding MarR family transcriptional regulator [Streptomonospora nanhaiensis]
MHDVDRTANLLGATALAVTDMALAGATGAAGVSASGAAALVVLSAAPGISVTELGRRVGLSQPATARMVDALERRGLVERRPGVGRLVAVAPTAAGEQAARGLLAARGRPLADVVSVLDTDERAVLAGLLAKLLRRLYGDVGDPDLLCRLCDRAACVRDATCPVGQADREARAATAGDDAAPRGAGGGAGAAP